MPMEEKFNLAFTLEDYFTNELKNDSKYIKWFARMSTAENGEGLDFEVPFKPCTQEDFDSFFPPNKGALGPLEKIKSDPKRQLMCFDWTDIEFYGTERTLNNARIEILFLPCNHRLTQLGGKEDRIDPECVADLDE